MATFVYPETLANVDKNILKPTKEYKLEVIKVLATLLLFVTVYLLLVIMAIGLALLVSFLGLKLIIMKPMFITLIIGIGLVGIGLMVVFFLVKFIFSKRKFDRSGFLEINKSEHPELFSFIDRLRKDTHVRKPKRVYLTTDVNASVFYDSSFFSMFFPVRKNLLIGLGFVNSVNISEFKAVLAHEFGHFSQRSMRLGSYVSNVNRIIYNMLFENEGYANAIDSWATSSGYFYFFAKLTIKIVGAIQWVLQQVYVVVNKTNLSLSRQMEHQADTVSAVVCGSNHLITSLHRLEIADLCYNVLLDKYNNWIAENYKPDNMFTHHREILNHFASDHKMETVNGLPVFDTKNQEQFRQSRIVVKDQWSSHPSTKDRDSYLKTLNIPDTEVINESPWVLFNDANSLQLKITDKLFSKVKFNGVPQILTLEIFKEKYYQDFSSASFQPEYNGFYNNRKIEIFNLDENLAENNPTWNFEGLYSNENTQLPAKLQILKSEVELLKSLNDANTNIKTFDFDGKKHELADIPNILEQLTNEETVFTNKINKLDKEIYSYFISKACEADKGELKSLYQRYFNVTSDTDAFISDYTNLSNQIHPIYVQKMSLDKAREIIAVVKQIESNIQLRIKNVIFEAKEANYLTVELLEKLDWYLTKDREYIDGVGYKNTELEVLNDSLQIAISMFYKREFIAKKRLLQKQLDIIQKS